MISTFLLNRSKKKLAGRNILIVSQNFLYGGLETQVRGQILEMKNKGWQVHLAAGVNFSDAYVPKITDSVTSGISMDYNQTVGALIESVEQLSKIITTNKITIIHSHPFTSLLSSYIAASIHRIPIIITLHGPASLAGVGKNYDTILGELLSSSNVIAVSEETANIARKLRSGVRPLIIPNGVNISEDPVPDNTTFKRLPTKWLVASRLDQEKIIGIKHFIETAVNAGVKKIDIAGDGPNAQELADWVISKQMSKKVKLIGLTKNIPKLLEKYDASAGMGRVVLESLEKKCITALIGYDGLKGVVNNEQTFKLMARNNFSGRNLVNISSQEFINQCMAITQPHINHLYEIVSRDYNQQLIWKDFIHYATTCRTYPKGDLNKLYSKLVNDKSLRSEALYASDKVNALMTETLGVS